MIYGLALFSIALGAFGQFLLKLGAGHIHNNTSALQMIISALVDPLIIAALFCYVMSVGVWILVLQKLPLSLAYPMVSLGYIMVIGLSWAFLHEHIGSFQFIGSGLIVLGVIMMNFK